MHVNASLGWSVSQSLEQTSLLTLNPRLGSNRLFPGRDDVSAETEMMSRSQQGNEDRQNCLLRAGENMEGLRKVQDGLM